MANNKFGTIMRLPWLLSIVFLLQTKLNNREEKLEQIKDLRDIGKMLQKIWREVDGRRVPFEKENESTSQIF